MKILGINGLNHDAAVALIEDGEVLFAGHSERYTGNKNDSDLNDELIADCLRYGKPDKIAYFERPYLKKLRQFIKDIDCFKNSKTQFDKSGVDEKTKISYIKDIIDTNITNLSSLKDKEEIILNKYFKLVFNTEINHFVLYVYDIQIIYFTLDL